MVSLLSPVQEELAILHDRVYQAQGSTSSPRPKFPFAAVGVRDTPPAPSQDQPQPVTAGVSDKIAQPLSTLAGGNPYTRPSVPSTTTTVGGVGTNVTGFYNPTVPQPGQTGTAGYGGFANITQPFPGQVPSTTTGAAIMQPSYVTGGGGGGQATGQPPSGRSNTYAVDEPMTWNDPPTLKSKKVM